MAPIRTQVFVTNPEDPDGPALVDYSTRTVRIDRERDVQVHLTAEEQADVSLFLDRENATALRDALTRTLNEWTDADDRASDDAPADRPLRNLQALDFPDQRGAWGLTIDQRGDIWLGGQQFTPHDDARAGIARAIWPGNLPPRDAG